MSDATTKNETAETKCATCSIVMRRTLGGVLHCDGCGAIRATREWLARFSWPFTTNDFAARR